MSPRSFACLVLLSLASGQAAQPSSSTPSSQQASASKVGADDPVITLNGFCADSARPESACKTVVTRAEFERLIDALQPGMALDLRLKVAVAYARNLKMAAAAEKRGLDKTPRFEEEMRYARLQILAQDLDRALRADANNITDADLAGYYKTYEPSFEEATLARIFIPHAKHAAAKTSAAQPDQGQEKDAQEDADEEAMTRLAADLRARAAKGEDPDKLQIEAYTAAGIPGTTPVTKMEKVRRATLPPQHESVMDMKPGEVSEVFSDPGGAHFIYKMISKQTLALAEVKAEIRAAISSQRYRDSMKSFRGDVVLSDDYFNPPGRSTVRPQRNPQEKRRKPAADQESGHD
jgi:hypothetical protein